MKRDCMVMSSRFNFVVLYAPELATLAMIILATSGEACGLPVMQSHRSQPKLSSARGDWSYCEHVKSGSKAGPGSTIMLAAFSQSAQGNLAYFRFPYF